MEELHEQIEQRVRKLEEQRRARTDPYDGRCSPHESAAAVHAAHGAASHEDLEQTPAHTTVAGRIIALRDFGKACFAHIQDATGRIQIYIKKDLLGEKFSLVKSLDVGDMIGVAGRLFRTPPFDCI